MPDEIHQGTNSGLYREAPHKNSQFSDVKLQQQKANAAGYQHLYHLVGKIFRQKKPFRSSCNTKEEDIRQQKTNSKIA